MGGEVPRSENPSTHIENNMNELDTNHAPPSGWECRYQGRATNGRGYLQPTVELWSNGWNELEVFRVHTWTDDGYVEYPANGSTKPWGVGLPGQSELYFRSKESAQAYAQHYMNKLGGPQ